MKNKYWTIEFVDMEGVSHYEHIVAMDIMTAVKVLCKNTGFAANQVLYASGKEVEVA